jgi:hypothetical protein
LCKHAESPMSSSLPACRDTTCTEPRIEACITCTCTNFGLQSMAHNNWGVPIDVLTSVNNAPWCVVRKSLLYPLIELHGYRGNAWREIKCVPVVTDFMGRGYTRQARTQHAQIHSHKDTQDVEKTINTRNNTQKRTHTRAHKHTKPRHKQTYSTQTHTHTHAHTQRDNAQTSAHKAHETHTTHERTHITQKHALILTSTHTEMQLCKHQFCNILNIGFT